MTTVRRIWRSRFNIPRRTFWYFARQLIERLRLFEVPILEQESQMTLIGLNRKEGLRKLNTTLKDLFGKEYDERDGMFSEHLILFASIAVSGRAVRKILEIGTFDGRTALILSKLFPASQITTIDLPQNEDEFKSTYNRGNTVEKFVVNRNRHIDEAPNVEFRKMNSLQLSNCNESFDLTWIDGAHGYPTVAMDIINSYRLASNDGYVLIDDIWKAVGESDNMYQSIGGFESLNSLVDAELISSFSLFPKRLSGQFNYPGNRKYVGFFLKR